MFESQHLNYHMQINISELTLYTHHFLLYQLATSRVLVGFDKCYEASAVLCSKQVASAKSQNLQKKSWECQESNPGLLGAKIKHYPLCCAAPQHTHYFYFSWTSIKTTNPLPACHVAH